MSEGREKGRGFLGRLFGRRDEKPADEAAKPETPSTPDAPAGDREAPQPANPPEDVAPAASPAATPAAASEPAEAEAEPAPAPAEPEKRSWFQRLKSGLTKTSSRLSDGITGLFTKKKLDATTLDELEDLLIQADLGVDTAMRITESISKGRYDKGIAPEDVKAVLAAEVERVLAPVAKPLVIEPTRHPHVVLVVGVNGSGKTTTIGKLAARLRSEGRTLMIAAGDTFRAAAIDQLKVWGERTGTPVVSRPVGSDASGLAFDALKEAQEAGTDVLLIDTAGRLQNKQALMDELEKVIRVLRKLDPTAPHDVLLVLDATTGQNALSQVEVFKEKAGVTGLVMTKLDGTARGGILVAIAAKHGLPVHAIGVGEGVDDLQAFDAREFAQAIAVG
ncbi:MAG: signal recognition particle-docking protein FtsY [Hyphomicrobiaceae bacterium]